jgi:ankyrin repeat protein
MIMACNRKVVLGVVAALVALLALLYGYLKFYDWLNYERPAALFSAVRNNDIAKIDLCLKYGANIESYEMYGWHRENKGDTPLTTAIQRSSSTTVAYLLEKGADPNRRWGVGGSTPALDAAIRGDVTIIELLRDAGADFSVGVGDFTPLEAAIRSKHEGAVIAIRKILESMKPDK